MSREILFRGKTKDGRWVYGDLVRRLVETTWQDILGEYQFAIAGKGEREKTVDFKNKRAEVISCTTVDPATVGQFTGLCDKNGVKIFEGDVVASDAWCCKCHVVYMDGGFTLEEGETAENLGANFCDSYGYELDDVKVIGNIHDNAELVKEEENDRA